MQEKEGFNHSSVCPYLFNFQEQDPWSPVFFYSTWDTLMAKYLLDGFGFGKIFGIKNMDNFAGCPVSFAPWFK